MKRIITIIIAMLLLLSGCNSTQSNQTEIANEETEQMLSDQTDTPSELVTELPTELTKIKKTVETWTGGKESGYLSKLEEYDENGKAIKTTTYDKVGNTTSTEEWIRESESSGGNRIARVQYKSSGSLGEATREYTYEYNTNEILTKMTFKEKRYNLQGEESITKIVEEYEYDSQGNLIKTIKNGRFGDEYKYEYDKNNNILKTWRKITQDGDFNLIAEYEYSMEGILQQKITYNSDGLSVTYTYNEDGTLIDEYGWPSFSDETVHKKYNEKGLLLEESDTTNHTKTTTYEYNENDDLIRKYWYDNWDGGSSGLTEYAITYWN